jgi:hypothetical protein
MAFLALLGDAAAQLDKECAFVLADRHGRVLHCNDLTHILTVVSGNAIGNITKRDNVQNQLPNEFGNTGVITNPVLSLPYPDASWSMPLK